MAIKDELERLAKSKAYKDFAKKHPDAKLAHAFIMMEKGNRSEWQIGYYLKGNDQVITFFMHEEIKTSPPSKIFKEPRKKVLPLDIEKVSMTFSQAFDAALEFQKEKYPTEKPAKILCILQHLEEGTVYNITFVTPAFNTLNIRVDAKAAEVTSHRLTSLLDFRAK
ncbi:MAG: hypothetical protein ABIC95_02350 [archaeon]